MIIQLLHVAVSLYCLDRLRGEAASSSANSQLLSPAFLKRAILASSTLSGLESRPYGGVGSYHQRVWGESQCNKVRGVSRQFEHQLNAVGGHRCACRHSYQEAHVVCFGVAVVWAGHAQFAGSTSIPSNIQLESQTQTHLVWFLLCFLFLNGSFSFVTALPQ